MKEVGMIYMEFVAPILQHLLLTEYLRNKSKNIEHIMQGIVFNTNYGS